MSEEIRQKIILSKCGKGNGRTGRKHTEETKNKIRLAHIGKTHGATFIRNFKHTPEQVEKMRQSLLKRFADKTNHPRFGKSLTEDSKLKMRLSHLGQTQSLETRKKLSELRTGCKHWNWKEDRSSLKKSEKKHLDPSYRIWALTVKERDGWKCKISDVNCSGRLESHHILPWRDFPELRYSPNNGITLCHAHHPRGVAEEKRHESFFMELISCDSIK